jgi:hypothetical protein
MPPDHGSLWSYPRRLLGPKFLPIVQRTLMERSAIL